MPHPELSRLLDCLNATLYSTNGRVAPCGAELSRLLDCLNATPDDEVLWPALADCLEEGGEPLRAELVRLNRSLRAMKKGPRRSKAEARVRELVNGGVRPCVPEIVNSLGMRFALIPAGTFWMGSPEDEVGRSDDPVEARHKVTITQAYWIGVFPVTQAHYEVVMGKNPSWFSKNGSGKAKVQKMDTASFPVEQVSWDEAVEFCDKLSKLFGELAGRVYRLPTEAEWEFACRAGSSTAFAFGSTISSLEANFDTTVTSEGKAGCPSRKRTTAVGSYRPNAWGLHDMHGNVAEWTANWDGPHPSGPVIDPLGPNEGYWRAFRGGNWNSFSWRCRSACRGGTNPAARDSDLGFRVVLARLHSKLIKGRR